MAAAPGMRATWRLIDWDPQFIGRDPGRRGCAAISEGRPLSVDRQALIVRAPNNGRGRQWQLGYWQAIPYYWAVTFAIPALDLCFQWESGYILIQADEHTL